MSKKTEFSKNIVLILFILILINLLNHGPTLIKAVEQPEGKWFTGQTSWFDPWDINFYAGVIGWGKRNGILFENIYDTQAHSGMPIYSFYTLLGKLSSPFNLPNISVFHLSAFILSFPLAIVIWWFIKIFLKDKTEKRAVFILLFLGGGLGWLFFPKTLLSDIGQPGFTLANAFQRPHEAVSLILMLACLGNFWQGVVCGKKLSLFWGGLWFFLMLFLHPYNSLILGAIFLCFGFYWFFKAKSTDFFKVLILIGIETGIYYFLIGKNLLTSPSLSELVSQVQHSPPLWQSILGWGILFPLVLATIFLKKKDDRLIFFTLWFTSHWLITYFPIGFQRSLARGLWIPTAILAIKGGKEISRRTKWDYSLIIGLLLIFSSFSTFFMSFKKLAESPKNRWIYLTQEEGEIIHYLEEHGNNEEGVLASYRIANIIPAYTSKRVWAGHIFATPQVEKRLAETHRFFSGTMAEKEAKNFLKEAKIVWIFWGPEEKAIAKLTNIPNENLMELEIKEKSASLYRIK